MSVDLYDVHFPCSQCFRAQWIFEVCLLQTCISIKFALFLALWVVLTYMKALLSLMARIRIMDTVIRILSYLDNWFLYAPTMEQGIQDTATLLKPITPLGLAA